MTTPRTPLLVAPPGESDLFGQTMLSTDLIRGLRRINPAIYVHQQGPEHTGIWIGQPGVDGTKFVCAFHLGAVPEWTQIDPNGKLICKGWRAIFEKVVRHGAASQRALEREFRISLDDSGASNLCGKCVRVGHRERHNGGALRMCDTHESVYTQAVRDKANEQELVSRLDWRRKVESLR